MGLKMLSRDQTPIASPDFFKRKAFLFSLIFSNVIRLGVIPLSHSLGCHTLYRHPFGAMFLSIIPLCHASAKLSFAIFVPSTPAQT